MPSSFCYFIYCEELLVLCVKLSSGFVCCCCFFNYKYIRLVELSLSVKLICHREKAAGTGFGSATGEGNLSIHMKCWNSNWNICFSQQAPRASLRIKPTAKFSLVSLESVSEVIRSGHLWREWRLSRGSLSPWALAGSCPALGCSRVGSWEYSMELGIFCGARDSRDIVGFFKGHEIPALISLLTYRSWAK